MNDDQTVAITGAASGLGHELALQLASKGYRVFGTALPTEDTETLIRAGDGRIVLTTVDITDEESVQRWADEINIAIGDHGLDVLINNAGILTPGPLESVPLAAIRREFEVNVFGGIGVTNALLPGLRRARGRIVWIGAMTGRLPLPFNGPSSATKATIEALADVYRAELSPFGIDVVVAQAGNLLTGGPVKTAETLRQAADSLSDGQRELYGQAFARFSNSLNAMQSTGLPADQAASRIIELVEQDPAPSRAPVGEDAENILRQVSEKSDDELNILRLQVVGLDRN